MPGLPFSKPTTCCRLVDDVGVGSPAKSVRRDLPAGDESLGSLKSLKADWGDLFNGVEGACFGVILSEPEAWWGFGET